jgi:hypothetical protein
VAAIAIPKGRQTARQKDTTRNEVFGLDDLFIQHIAPPYSFIGIAVQSGGLDDAVFLRAQ